MIFTYSWLTRINEMLEGVVRQSNQAQALTIASINGDRLDIRQHLDNVRTHSPFGMTLPRLAPRGTVPPNQVGDYSPLQLRLRNH